MTEQEILRELTLISRQIFNNDTLVLTPETTADDVPEWDSFNHINIIIAAEARFGIKFKTAETEELRNVGDFVRLIAKKTKPP